MQELPHHYHVSAKAVPEGSVTPEGNTDADKAKQLLEKAETNCLVSNSLNSTIHLHATVSPAG